MRCVYLEADRCGRGLLQGAPTVADCRACDEFVPITLAGGGAVPLRKVGRGMVGDAQAGLPERSPCEPKRRWLEAWWRSGEAWRTHGGRRCLVGSEPHGAD